MMRFSNVASTVTLLIQYEHYSPGGRRLLPDRQGWAHGGSLSELRADLGRDGAAGRRGTRARHRVLQLQ